MKQNNKNADMEKEYKVLKSIFESMRRFSDLDSILEYIAKSLSGIFKVDSCLIYLKSTNSDQMILSGTWPPHPQELRKIRLEKGEGITGWVESRKRPVMISRRAFKDKRFKVFQNLPEDKYESLFSVPIIHSSGAPLGIINFQKKKPFAFDLKSRKLILNISKQISGVIELNRTIHSFKEKAKQLDIVAQLFNSIVSSNYLQEILQLIVTMTAQMMNSKICSLMLYDSKNKQLHIAATQSLSQEYLNKPPVKVSRSISGKALKLNMPISILDVTGEPGYGYPDIAKREGLQSMLAVPMVFKGKPIGVVNCYTTVKHVFTEQEINILQTISNQAAIAIENTRLLEESHAAKEALETRKIVERAKGILMREKRYSEEEAFQFIQKQAMDKRQTMRRIAEAILLTEGLKE